MLKISLEIHPVVFIHSLQHRHTKSFSRPLQHGLWLPLLFRNCFLNSFQQALNCTITALWSLSISAALNTNVNLFPNPLLFMCGGIHSLVFLFLSFPLRTFLGSPLNAFLKCRLSQVSVCRICFGFHTLLLDNLIHFDISKYLFSTDGSQAYIFNLAFSLPMQSPAKPLNREILPSP